MNRIMKFLLILLLCTGNSHAQPTQKFLDSLYDEIQFLIGDEWYLEPTEKGFQVTFCRSCAENCKKHYDTTTHFLYNVDCSDFFDEGLYDSVAIFSHVNGYNNTDQLSPEERHNYFTDKYRPDAILRYEFTIEKTWSKWKVAKIQEMNDELRDSILREPLYKSNMAIFSDYRFWLPSDRWKNRTQSLNFYFQQLPYSSGKMDASIFLKHNQNSFFSGYMLVDKNDPKYYENERNLLQDTRYRTLKIIALALGLEDFKIIIG